MTAPIRFTCQNVLPGTPHEIANHILDLSNWPGFRGYGPIPGIRQAEFEVRTADVVGTKIRAVNCDGSTHVEEIVAWDLPDRIQLRIHHFSAPVSRFARQFDETCEFTPAENGTHIMRTMELHASSALTRPFLWVISRLLKRAFDRHLEQLRSNG